MIRKEITHDFATRQRVDCCAGLVPTILGRGAGSARAQRFGPALGTNPISTPGYGSVGGYGVSPYGYGITNGRLGSGYQSAGGLYNRAYQAARPQTTIAYQPLINAITSLTDWNGPVHRPRRRLHSQASAPRIQPFDADGKIVWPSTVPDDPAAAKLRQAAEEAVRNVVHESKSTGHGSVRAVIDAKNKLSAFENKVLPEVKTKNTTDGAGAPVLLLRPGQGPGRVDLYLLTQALDRDQ